MGRNSTEATRKRALSWPESQHTSQTTANIHQKSEVWTCLEEQKTWPEESKLQIIKQICQQKCNNYTTAQHNHYFVDIYNGKQWPGACMLKIQMKQQKAKGDKFIVFCCPHLKINIYCHSHAVHSKMWSLTPIEIFLRYTPQKRLQCSAITLSINFQWKDLFCFVWLLDEKCLAALSMNYREEPALKQRFKNL